MNQTCEAKLHSHFILSCSYVSACNSFRLAYSNASNNPLQVICCIVWRQLLISLIDVLLSCLVGDRWKWWFWHWCCISIITFIAVVPLVTSEMLKEEKNYQKLLRKQQKELDNLSKKHSKVSYHFFFLTCVAP